jgi:hypothetical protein
MDTVGFGKYPMVVMKIRVITITFVSYVLISAL